LHDQAQDRPPGEFDQTLGQISDGQILWSVNLTLTRPLFPENQSEQRGLASPIRANQTNSIARSDIEVTVSEDVLMAIELCQALDLYHVNIPTIFSPDLLGSTQKNRQPGHQIPSSGAHVGYYNSETLVFKSVHDHSGFSERNSSLFQPEFIEKKRVLSDGTRRTYTTSWYLGFGFIS
jgi:hypothetical protein